MVQIHKFRIRVTVIFTSNYLMLCMSKIITTKSGWNSFSGHRLLKAGACATPFWCGNWELYFLGFLHPGWGGYSLELRSLTPTGNMRNRCRSHNDLFLSIWVKNSINTIPWAPRGEEEGSPHTQTSLQLIIEAMASCRRHLRMMLLPTAVTCAGEQGTVRCANNLLPYLLGFFLNQGLWGTKTTHISQLVVPFSAHISLVLNI